MAMSCKQVLHSTIEVLLPVLLPGLMHQNFEGTQNETGHMFEKQQIHSALLAAYQCKRLA